MSSTKTAIVVLSDPQAGEEALGRLFNALAATYDFKQKQQDVQLVFQGTGTRWTGLLTKPDHPAHALYKAVEDRVAGVSAGCADIFGAREDAQRNGFSLIAANAVPGTSGLPSLASYVSEGYAVVTF
jgi:DsrE/DsrF/DsrH-like protein